MNVHGCIEKPELESVTDKQLLRAINSSLENLEWTLPAYQIINLSGNVDDPGFDYVGLVSAGCRICCDVIPLIEWRKEASRRGLRLRKWDFEPRARAIAAWAIEASKAQSEEVDSQFLRAIGISGGLNCEEENEETTECGA
jgi:hypothetical protein